MSLVAANRGVCIASEDARRYYFRPDITYLPISDAPPIQYGLVWRFETENPGRWTSSPLWSGSPPT